MRIAAMLLPAVLSLLPAAALAAGTLYKWTDENGVTHYTDAPPADTAYETRAVPSSTPASPVAEIAPAEVSENCRRVRENVATLERPGEVLMDLDGDGEAEALDLGQKTAQLEVARRQVGIYCSTTPPEATLPAGADPGER